MTHASAVSKVEKIGYELVETPKPVGKAATMKDYAKFDFEPWPEPERDKESGLISPSDKLMLRCGFLVRTAQLACSRTKEQLGDMYEEDTEIIDNLMAD